jgi:acetoacetyl-CoA synthetase
VSDAGNAELWRPSAARAADANLTRFLECVNVRHGLALRDYDALHRWSIERPAQFWGDLARFADVRASWGNEPVLQHAQRMPGARWFGGTRLNFAENLLRFRDEQAALVFVSESGEQRSLSFRALHQEVARVAMGLRELGLRPGDRVAGFLPNIPETVVAMLATASIGAIWSSCSPDFGVNGVLERFGQIAPRVLFTADGYRYAGKALESIEPIAGVLARLPSVERVIVVPYAGALRAGALERLPQAVEFSTFGRPASEISFAQLDFDHPLYIVYSSGTTGMPKCIVHGAGGTLLQHRKEHLLHVDLRRSDRIFYFTTCGWMMWNWLVSALATGATVVLFDGSPFHPDPGVLWRVAEQQRISIFGTSAKYLASLEKSGYRPVANCRLEALRALLSTGSPLAPEGFDFVYRDVKSDVLLASISGGTDILSCFCLGNPLLPVYRGEIQCRGLGMDVRIVDSDGRELPHGETGELVCVRPFPSMPVGFWNDPDGARYRSAYFERFPGIWHHGDWAQITAHGGLVISGRSDAVLNPGGVRIGTAEIYRQVEQLDEVLESICIGQQWQGDVRIVLFVRLRPGLQLDEPLRQRIRDTIRRHTTPRHVPAKIVAVADIPRTLSGKIVELAVRDVVHGRSVKSTDALANPAALELYRNLPELAT